MRSNKCPSSFCNSRQFIMNHGVVAKLDGLVLVRVVRDLSELSGDVREVQFLYQLISVVVQRWVGAVAKQ